MNIENDIKLIYTGKVNFELEQNVDYANVDVLETNTLTHYLCYLAPDNNVYNSKSEYERTI